MAVYGDGFTYNGHSSREFGVILGSTSSNSKFEMGLGQSLITGSMNKYRHRQFYNGRKYNSVLSFDFSIIKDPCREDANNGFNRAEVRRLNRWLTGNDTPGVLHFYDDGEYIDYICNITSVSDSTGGTYGDIIELTYTVTCDSPYGYSALNKVEIDTTKGIIMYEYQTDDERLILRCEDYSVSYSSESLNLNSFNKRALYDSGSEAIVIDATLSTVARLYNDSDEINDYIYPMIDIVPKETGLIEIYCHNDDDGIMISVTEGMPIHINCELQQFYDDDENLLNLEDMGLSNESDIYIPRLYSGSNDIEIVGDCDITFSYRCPRKVGAF